METTFYLPGFSNHFKFNYLFISMLKKFPQRFREGVKIGAVYGDFPTSLWNGGRAEGGFCEERFMREVVKQFNSIGVPIRYTFTNPMLKEEHLSDPYCNFCLQIADNGFNEVTVFSPILEEYIRKNYPSYKIISSTCKELRTMDEVNKELEKDYKMVVLDYNWNNRFEELDKINPEYRDKCEILVNASCIPDCQRRGEHYRTIGLNSINFCEAMKNNTQYEEIPFECKYGSDNVIYTIQDYSTYVKPDDVFGKYAEMGFKHFKIEGRTGPLFGKVESYLHYMAIPELRDETRLALLFRLIDNGVIKVPYK